jgi:hypothetical protein
MNDPIDRLLLLGEMKYLPQNERAFSQKNVEFNDGIFQI